MINCHVMIAGDKDESLGLTVPTPSVVQILSECPVCYEPLLGIIGVCVNGHCTCTNCFPRVFYCPVCRCRNYSLATILEDGTLRCAYTNEGCTAVLEAHAYVGHVTRCDYRKIECDPMSKVECRISDLSYKRFIHHLRTQQGIQNLNNGFELSRRFWRNALIKNSELPFATMEFDNQIFFYNCAKFNANLNQCDSKDEFTLRWWISGFAPQEITTKYTCTITLSSHSNKDLRLTWTGPIHNFRNSNPKEITEETKYLAATSSTLLSYCSSDEDPRFLHSYIESAHIFKNSV